VLYLFLRFGFCSDVWVDVFVEVLERFFVQSEIFQSRFYSKQSLTFIKDLPSMSYNMKFTEASEKVRSPLRGW